MKQELITNVVNVLNVEDIENETDDVIEELEKEIMCPGVWVDILELRGISPEYEIEEILK